jgi:hypothetical protein
MACMNIGEQLMCTCKLVTVKQWLTCCCIVYFDLEAASISKHIFRKKELAAGTAISEALLQLHN